MILKLKATAVPNDLGYAFIDIIGMQFTPNARLVCSCNVYSTAMSKWYQTSIDWTDIDTAITIGAYSIQAIVQGELTKDEI